MSNRSIQEINDTSISLMSAHIFFGERWDIPFKERNWDTSETPFLGRDLEIETEYPSPWDSQESVIMDIPCHQLRDKKAHFYSPISNNESELSLCNLLFIGSQKKILLSDTFATQKRGVWLKIVDYKRGISQMLTLGKIPMISENQVLMIKMSMKYQ